MECLGTTSITCQYLASLSQCAPGRYVCSKLGYDAFSARVRTHKSMNQGVEVGEALPTTTVKLLSMIPVILCSASPTPKEGLLLPEDKL